MFTSEHYQLLDFGQGRKLERFGQLVLDRPCPAADDFEIATPAAWRAAAARFERDAVEHRLLQREEAERGVWKPVDVAAETWSVEHAPFRLELRATEFGHLGLFPEQADNWDWIARQVQRAGRPLKVLNLFAYTGGSTLAAAAAGAEVVHVDAARTSVAWARRNAQLSGLAEAPIRWLVDDARKFVRRELKRGNSYDAVILDPPTYGHGTKGEVWKLSKHLPALLQDCGELTAASRQFMLLSCHSPGIGPAELEAYLADAILWALRCRRARGGVVALHGRWPPPAQRRRGPLARLTGAVHKLSRYAMPAETITSLQNPRIKQAAKLRDRRQREKQGRFIIDGARELLRAIESGLKLEEVFVCEALCRSDDSQRALDALRRAAAAIDLVTPAVFEKLAFGERLEGLLAVAKTPNTSLADLRLPPNALVAVLEGIEKPGNIGAVLRSADGAGVSAVVLADGVTDLYNPNAIRASLGTIFTLPIATATSSETLAWLRQQQLRIFAAWVDAPQAYTTVDYIGPAAVVLGGEAHGLSPVWSGEEIVRIGLPMRGIADSLNVSAAAAVLFYEALRQRNAF